MNLEKYLVNLLAHMHVNSCKVLNIRILDIYPLSWISKLLPASQAEEYALVFFRHGGSMLF